MASLEAWRRPSDAWIGYAKYNIGVSLVRLGQVEAGARVLDEVGQLDPENPELDALRDKANVALGYAWLQASRPVEAKPSLQRVRLDGPFSNKALLGVGWSDAEIDDFEGALAPWLALRDRSLLDSAVQESLLAVPYAFAQLGADKQAADHYTTRSTRSTRDRAAQQSIDAIENGQLITELLGEHADASTTRRAGTGASSVCPTRSRAAISTSCSRAIVSRGPQELPRPCYLNRNLDRWVESLGAFDDILDTRQRAYEQRLPSIDVQLCRASTSTRSPGAASSSSRGSQAIERSEDVVALGTAREQETWATLTAMESKLARLPTDAESDELRTKHRFLQGFAALGPAPRLQGAPLGARRRALGELDRQLREAQRRHHQVESGRDEWPEKFAGLTARIDGLRPRVLGMQSSAQTALLRQQLFLQDLAVAELKAQRDRLNTYMVQARFALASIYDRAAARVAPAAEQTRSRGRRSERRAHHRAARRRGDLAVRAAQGRRRDGHHQGPRALRRRDRHERADRGQRSEGDGELPLVSRPRVDDPLLQAEAMRRLADLQLETTEAQELQANLQALGDLGGTIGMYEKLLESYPNYAKNDLVLYQLARAYEAEGRIEESLATLDRLIAEYPRTPHIDEAQFRRGETLFVQKDYEQAEDAYAEVLKRNTESVFYEQALYKHGWSLFKQQAYGGSLSSFFSLLDLRFGVDNDAAGERDPAVIYSRMGRAEQEIIDDTFRVLSIGFSYLDGPEAVSKYFSRNGARPYAFIVYTNLGDLYLEQERYQDAADAYHAFVELDPYHAKAPLLQVEVIEAFKQGGFADLVLEAKQGSSRPTAPAARTGSATRTSSSPRSSRT